MLIRRAELQASWLPVSLVVFVGATPRKILAASRLNRWPGGLHLLLILREISNLNVKDHIGGQVPFPVCGSSFCGSRPA
jgi:hypothetical protein